MIVEVDDVEAVDDCRCIVGITEASDGRLLSCHVVRHEIVTRLV